MKKEPRIAFSVVGALMFVALLLGMWPLTSANAQATAPQEQTAPQTQSVSGKITSVEKNSFTLSIATAMSNHQQQFQETARPTTMTFAIDKNTTIDGKLKVGANADVTYREDAGKNIALSVRVSQ